MTSFLELIDNTLGTHFHTPVYDPKAGQKKLVRVIDLAAKQHSENITRAPNRSWATGNNNAISFAPKIDGKPVRIGGKEINYVPAERFQDFLSGLKAAVEAGDLDKEIKAAIDAPKPEGAAASSSRGTGNVGGGRSALANVRSSFGRSLSNGKSLEEAEASARAKGFDEALIAQVKEEKRAAQ